MVSVYWTSEEEEYLKQHFAIGNKDDIVKELDRTWVSIKRKAHSLGLKRQNLGKGRKAWSKEEEKYLRDNFATLPKEELEKYLNRTWLSIQNRAHKLSLTRLDFHQREWTEEEDAILQEMYPQGSQEEVLKRLDWSWDAICRRAERINVKRDLSHIHSVRERDDTYSEEEIEYLKQNFEKGSKEDIATHLNRKWEAILAYANRSLGLKRNKDLAYANRNNPNSWTKQEVQILKNDYNEKSISEIAKIVNRTERAVHSKASQQNLLLPAPIWTAEEDKVIEQYFEEGDPLEILDLLPNRTWTAISEHARKSLKLKRKKNIWHSERRMKRLLDQIFPNDEYEDNISPEWLINPDTGRQLELDRYYPHLEIAFEYNGKQHYEPVFSSDIETESKKVERQIKCDESKRKVCEEHNITLIVVKYSDHLTISNVRRIIQENKEEVLPEVRESLLDWVQQYYPDAKRLRDGNYEIEVFIPEVGIGIEYVELSSHQADILSGQGINGRKYLLNKTKHFKEKGIRIIHIFEHEWRDRRKQVQSFLQSAIGKNTRKIGARLCKVIWTDAKHDIKDAHSFLEEYHIQGAVYSTKYIAKVLFDEEIVAVATFGKHHRNSKDWVLTRFCTKTGTTIQGLLSKISKLASREIKEDILSWADYRLSQGNGYEKAGWKFDRLLSPEYFYHDGNGEVVSKQSRQKKVIGTPENITEREHAKIDGLEPVYDCGKIRYKYIYQDISSQIDWILEQIK